MLMLCSMAMVRLNVDTVGMVWRARDDSLALLPMTGRSTEGDERVED